MSSTKSPVAVPPNASGFMPTALHIAEGLMVEELEHGCGGAGGLECDLALLRLGPQIGNEEAALAQGDLLT